MKKWALVIILIMAVAAAGLFYRALRPASAPVQIVPRLKTDNPAVISAVRKKLARDPGYTVLFVGDSLLYSSASRSDRDTIASSFARRLARQYPYLDIHVYDLSLPGCSLSNSRDIMRYMLPARPALVIMDVNLVWLNDTQIRHPALQNLNSAWSNPNLLPQKVPVFPEDLYRPWYEKDFAKLKNSGTTFGSYQSIENNKEWKAFLEIVSMLKNQSDTRAVFIFPPRNKALCDTYNLVNQSAFDRMTSRVKSELNAPNLYFFDYTWVMDSNLFSDMHHMLAPGNRRFGQILAEDVIDHKIPGWSLSRLKKAVRIYIEKGQGMLAR